MTSLQHGFVEDFRSPECAILALRLIMEKQQSGLTYSEILDYPGFVGLFSPDFVTGKSRYQMIVKLKNTVRDLRDGRCVVPPELEDVQVFFRYRKRRAVRSKLTLIEQAALDVQKQTDKIVLKELDVIIASVEVQ